ncbi:NusG domain II-containing protein [sulfur-oxidizing endosymbiont of Gigantopelta aegis]|uniref:NusG domain II-containing protein n=1 Tax=sulfur-oxidizing endosymbiont of Gigantopelta aegis TaxID=2794934 RepID=UPI0018DDAFA9|nr:NusG domain II-containing protein [sulfur-oxidizing endosymbiont of Gigantopelta aegis]
MNQKFKTTISTLFNPADIVILVLASTLSIWLYTLLWFDNSQQGTAERLLIQYADNPPTEYELDEGKSITIDGHLGPSIIEIKQGKARFIHSSCRNQLCVFHGWLTLTGDTTACLPNRISMTLKGSNNTYDAIAGGQ